MIFSGFYLAASFPTGTLDQFVLIVLGEIRDSAIVAFNLAGCEYLEDAYLSSSRRVYYAGCIAYAGSFIHIYTIAMYMAILHRSKRRNLLDLIPN